MLNRRISAHKVEINWDRHKFYHFTPFLNSVAEFSYYYGRTEFSVCKNLPKKLQNATVLYRWTILSEGLQTHQLSSTSCRVNCKIVKQGLYIVTVTGLSQKNKLPVLQGRQSLEIKDYWIAAIGDSYASGEGNPDIPLKLSDSTKAKWISESCHRSSRSWTFKVYQKLLNGSGTTAALYFSYLPCSGASVDSGIVSSRSGDSQLAVVQAITKLRGSGPELMLISAGGNDIGYSEILSTLNWGETRSLFSSLDMRFFYASNQLDKLAAGVRDIKPKQVIVPHYFDLSRNEKGEIDANCTDLRKISTKKLKLAERQILQRINALISKKCREQSWTVVENISSIFRFHGLCSSEPFIRSVKDSVRIQGDHLGAFHPTEEAHERIAELVLKQIRSFN